MSSRKWLVCTATLWVAASCVPDGEVTHRGSAATGRHHADPSLARAVADEPTTQNSGSNPAAAALPGEPPRTAEQTLPVTAPEGPDLVLVLPWGNTSRAAGRLDGDEGASEGPMSFAVSAAGEIYLLDQVNLRVLVFRSDGSLRREIPIPADTYQDIEVTADGTLLLLDRLANPSLLALDESGRILGEHAILGDGIAEGGLVTAMFARDDGVWLEIGHSHVVKVLEPGRAPATRLVQPGRIVQQGVANVSAALDRARGTAAIWLTDPHGTAIRANAEIALEHPAARIISIDSDATDHVHVFLHVVELDAGDPREVVAEKVVGIRFDHNLAQAGMLTSPHVITDWEQFREFRVTDAGAVYQMAFDHEGVRFYRWQW